MSPSNRDICIQECLIIHISGNAARDSGRQDRRERRTERSNHRQSLPATTSTTTTSSQQVPSRRSNSGWLSQDEDEELTRFNPRSIHREEQLNTKSQSSSRSERSDHQSLPTTTSTTISSLQQVPSRRSNSGWFSPNE